MSKIARQLCEDIVEPALSCEASAQEWNSVQLVAHQYPTRKIVIDREKTILEIDPTKLKGVTKFKSKDRILDKHYTDRSVNTLVTGPLKNVANNNNTTVRSKDQALCKCGMKQACKNLKSKARLRHQDKQTTHEITTSSRATQFLDCMIIKNIDPPPQKPQEHMGTQTIAFTRIEAGNQVFMSDVSWKPRLRKIPLTKPRPRVFEGAVPMTMNTPLRWSRCPMTYGPDF